MRALISVFAALLLATAAGCSKTDDSADREGMDQTTPSTTPGAPGDVTGTPSDTAPPADTTTDPSATPPPADQTTPPATDETTPPQQ